MEQDGGPVFPAWQQHPRVAASTRRGRLTSARPYGCSKGTADQYVLDYAHSFGLRAAVLRKSCIYGPRQFGTEDQGWVAHFLIRALRDEPITIYGDGKQVRDILHVRDAVAAYRSVLTHIDRLAGQAFNLGGGAGNAVSLRMRAGRNRRAHRPREYSQSMPNAGPGTSCISWPIPAGSQSRSAGSRESAGAKACVTWRSGYRADLGLPAIRPTARQAKGGRMKVALVNPPWTLRRQHLLWLPRAAFSA